MNVLRAPLIRLFIKNNKSTDIKFHKASLTTIDMTYFGFYIIKIILVMCLYENNVTLMKT